MRFAPAPDQAWRGVALPDAVIYEVHVGTFTPDGTLDSAIERLAELRDLGVTIEAPFMTLSFLALSVIPALKITDRGLVDVDRFEIVPLAAG